MRISARESAHRVTEARNKSLSLSSPGAGGEDAWGKGIRMSLAPVPWRQGELRQIPQG